MGDNHGFWTKNDDWIPVTEDHVTAILADPERFRMTRAGIEEIYASHGETIGNEGRARDEVIRRVTENGWVRIRRYNNMGVRIVVQGTRINEQISSIPEFVAGILQRDPVDGSATVVISDLANGDSRTFQVGASGVSDTVEGDLNAE